MKDGQKLALGAAGLSLMVPGLGQIVHRFYVVGLFWIVIATLFWNSVKPTLIIAAHVLSAVSAYWAVQRKYATSGRPRR
jgi:hypothetical protein